MRHEVVHRGQVVPAIEIVAQVKSEYGGIVESVGYRCQADKGQLRVEMTTSHFPAIDGPQVVIHRQSRHIHSIHLRDESELPVAGCEIGLEVVQKVEVPAFRAFIKRYFGRMQVDMVTGCQARLDASLGEIGIVKVVVSQIDEGCHQLVLSEHEGVQETSLHRAEVIVCVGVRQTDFGAEIEQMELGDVATCLVLIVTHVHSPVIGTLYSEILVAVIVSHVKVG